MMTDLKSPAVPKAAEKVVPVVGLKAQFRQLLKSRF
jgi:hypothetical protein